MPTKEVSAACEKTILDESALNMLEDHSCCGPVEEKEVTGVERTATQQGTSGPNGPSGASGAVTKGSSKNEARYGFRVRLAVFLAIALLILGTALWLIRPTDMGEQMADYTVEMSMSGFTPPSLDFLAGKAVTLKLVNRESPFHASGAEHQFAVDALGINEKLQAKQTRVISIPAQQAGEYTFYCDVCCGGQKSPTMRGKLTFH